MKPKIRENKIVSPLARYPDKLSENIYNNDLTIFHENTRVIVLPNCAPLYCCVNRENFNEICLKWTKNQFSIEI